MVILAILLNVTSFQNFLKDKAVVYLEKKLDTKVSMDNIRIDFFNKVAFKGLYIEDRQKDTLLYAGTFEGRLSDWLSINDKVKITYAKLDNAKVFLNRPTTDSIWNYQFIIDAFPSEKDTTKKDMPQIALEYLELNSVVFDMWDGWFGSDMIASVGHLEMAGEVFQPKEKTIIVDRLIGDNIVFGLRSYKGGKAIIHKTFEELYPLDTTAFNPDGWKVEVDKILLSNSNFFLRDEYTDITKIPKNQFDAAHLDIKKINIDINKLRIVNDTIFGKINNLTAHERSGIIIKKLSGVAKVSPNISEIKNLYLETNNSVLKDYYAMHYKRFPAFVNYIDSVVMEANLVNSSIAMSDIAYFAPALNRWDNEIFNTNAYGKGTVANLSVRNINIKGVNTELKGDYSIVGLPDIEKTIMRLDRGSVSTNYSSLVRLFPEIKKLDIKEFEKLSKIQYQGTFNGFYNNFVLNGVLNTNVGAVTTEGLNIDYRKDKILYDGRIKSTEGLQLNSLFPNQKLGIARFDMSIKGDGFDYKKDNIAARGHINSFDYNSYRYKDIDADININNGAIVSTIHSRDEHAKMNVNARISSLTSIPKYEFKGYIDRLMPQQLGFYNDYLYVSGSVEGAIIATNLKNLTGTIDAEDLFIVKGNDTLNLNTVSLNSQRQGSANTFSFSSNGLLVTVDGVFYLDDLVGSTQLFLSHYLPSYIKIPPKANPNQSFSFTIKGNNIDDVIKLSGVPISLPKGVDIRGNLDGMNQSLILDGNVPELLLKQVAFDNISIHSQGDLASINLQVQINKIISGEKILVRDIELMTNTSSDKMNFELATGNEESFGTAKIIGTAIAQNDSFYFNIEPSELFFNNNKWDITSGNRIVLAKDFLGISNLNIKSDDQWLRINNNIYHPNGNTLVALEKINIKPLMQMIGMDNSIMAGRINGTINIPNLMVSPAATFDIYTDTIAINDTKLGYIVAKGNYDYDNERLYLSAPSGIYDAIGKLDLEGFISLSDNDSSRYNLVAKARNTSLRWATPFVDNLVKDVSGFVNGNLYIGGNESLPEVKGKVIMSYAKMTPHITGVPYSIPNTIIDITPDQFKINRARVLDSDGNVGYLYGSILHNNFSNIVFNLGLNSDNIKVLGLKEYEGQNFYGDVYADARLSITGPLSQLNLDIAAIPQGKSKLFIPLSSSADLGAYEYITFKNNKAKSDSATVVKYKDTRINVNIDAIANDNLEVALIMDKVSGEQIVAKGNGNITLFIPDEGQIRLNGNYNIEEGFYDFTFNELQVFNYKRRFNIEEGSTISWSGDIINAAVSVNANAKVKARLYDLIINDIERISPSPSEISDAQLPQNVIVDLNMTGSLLNPELKFKIDLEENRSVGSYAYQKLKRINSEDRELLNQVVSLLLIEQFIPPEGINSGAMAMNAGVNNFSEVVSSFASGQLTNLTNRILGVQDLSVDFKYKNYSVADGAESSLNRNMAGLSVRKNFYNDRIILNVGGIYDWGETSVSAVNNNNPFSGLAGDFRLQYLINPDGRLRLNIFRTNNFDAIFIQNIGRHGIGLSYRRSFNSFTDIFKKRIIPIYPINTIDTIPAVDTNITNNNTVL